MVVLLLPRQVSVCSLLVDSQFACLPLNCNLIDFHFRGHDSLSMSKCQVRLREVEVNFASIHQTKGRVLYVAFMFATFC